MNKKLLFVIILLGLMPACSFRRKSSETGTVSGEYSEVGSKSGKKSLFVEDGVDAFVLEGEIDPFSAPLADGVDFRVVEDYDKSLWAENRARYGFETIYFDFDKFGLRNDQVSALDLNLKKIKELAKQGKTIIIEGHACDSAGSKSYNMMLSERRAKKIRDYLVKHGVSAARLKIVGRGNEMPIVLHGSREQQSPNRRVEFYVLESTARAG